MIKNHKNIQIPKERFSNTYSLKQNLFDPTNNSPPNEFMIKLHNRMKIYNSTSTSLPEHNKKN